MNINLGFKNRWTSLKRLNNVVNNIIASRPNSNIHELENLLQSHKPDFLSLSNNPVRTQLHKDVVLKAAKEGITVVQQQKSRKEVVSQEIVDEALLMSEIFDLNELTSLELIITGERQLPRYPGAARGPVAVMLYYDSQRSLLLSLKMLIQGLNGRSWSLPLPKEVLRLIHGFVFDLKREGIVEKALDKLETFNVKKELELLQSNRALGPGKFKKQVYDLVQEVRELYADVVFSFAAQSELSAEATQKLIKLIAKSEVDSSGRLDKVSTTLLMALLYLMDVGGLQYTDADNEQALYKYPAYSNNRLLKDINQAIYINSFINPGIAPIIEFANGLAARALNVFCRSREVEDESVIDKALDNKVFEHLSKLLVSNYYVYEEEFFARRIHDLLVDFAYLVPQKIKDMRDKGDEIGQLISVYAHEGITPPPSLSLLFEKYLQLLADFYARDKFQLSANIWKSAVEEGQTEPRFLSFAKFIKTTLEANMHQSIHVPLLKLLSALARTSPFNIYTLLRSSDATQRNQLSFDLFFKMFNQYLNSQRGADKATSGLTLNLSTANANNIIRPSVNITAVELDILCGALELIETIVSNDKNCALALAESQQSSCIPTLLGLIASPVSRKLKAAILSCLAGFANQTPSVALNIWLRLDGILPKQQIAASGFSTVQQQRSWQNGICIEIEDIEPRNEEYAITQAFLVLVKTLLKHVVTNREHQIQSLIDSTISFVVSAILLRLDSRNYKHEEEKWKLVVYSLEIINYMVNIYEPLSDGVNLRSSFSLYSQILQESTLFRSIFRIAEGVVDLLEPKPVAPNTDPSVLALTEKSLYLSISTLRIVSEKENQFYQLVSEIPGFPSATLVTSSTLFTNINPRTNDADRLSILLRSISLPNAQTQIEAMKLLQNLVKENSRISHHCLLQLIPVRKYHEDYLLHGFVDCLADNDELRHQTLQFILTFLKSDSILFEKTGLSHRLLGFDSKRKSLRIPGSGTQTFNCLHAIISFLLGDTDSTTQDRRLCLEILYVLSEDPDVSATTLRFLRTSYDLVLSYLTNLINEPSSATSLSEIGWFWRILATEIKQTHELNLRSHCSNYIKLLFGDSGSRKLTDLNAASLYTHAHPEMPKLEYFAVEELGKTLTECTTTEGLVDIKGLHQRLLNEIRQIGVQIGAVQAGHIQAEIKSILSFTSSLNTSTSKLNEKFDYFEGWQQLVEVTIAVPCLDIFEPGAKAIVLLELINELLHVLSNANTHSFFYKPISSIVLIAASRLRQCPAEIISKTHILSTSKAILNLLETPPSPELWSSNKRSRANFYAALLHLYKMVPAVGSNNRLASRLLEKLCKDALSGQELVKVLATSVLLENEIAWSESVILDGSLRQLIDSLSHDDREIKQNKCERYSKAYYAFESKMALFHKIGSSSSGAKLLMRSGIIETLSKLECVELYPHLVNKNEVCAKIFQNVIRLIVTICNYSVQKDHEHLSKFIVKRSAVLYDLLRMANAFEYTEEVKTVLILVTSLLSQLVTNATPQLQRIFIGSFDRFAEAAVDSDSQVLANISAACVKLCRNNGFMPLFSPTWESRESFEALGQPTMGSLLFSIDNSYEKAGRSRTHLTIIEMSLFLIWHHLNLYLSLLPPEERDRVQVERLREQARDMVSDQFFHKVQASIQGNSFVDAFIRRIKRIVHLNVQ